MMADLARMLADGLRENPPKTIGVAVSGGSDSLALLHLLHGFATDHACTLHVATVDHGLRPEAAAEAEMVGDICRNLGLSHEVLHWQGWDRSGNLQNEARKARYLLLADWGRRRQLDVIALGHTADDQAETFLMRLARRAGVDGLSAMPQRFERNGMMWIRPLLHARRAALQEYLTLNGINWASDPSNDDTRYDRVRIRNALAILEGIGVEAEALTVVAQNMTGAKEALTHQMQQIARDHVSLHAGAVAIDVAGLNAQPFEIRRRLIAHALKWVNGAYYAPRSAALGDVMTALATAPSATLQGCELRHRSGKLWIFRELQAVSEITCNIDTVWDGRWRITPPVQFTSKTDGLTLRALGPDGLMLCPDWRDLGLPRGVLLSSPAVWQDARLVAAPLAGASQNWQAVLERGKDTFFAVHITH